MKIVNFIFGIHCHQPVGNFDYVFEDAYRQSYLPFIEIVEEFPNLHISFHFSGCLLEWIEEHHPDYLDRITHLVERGNIEIISGGFYEPVLAVIPDIDKIGQIQMMNDYILNRFNYNPKGLWLTERVWEPHLAKPIAEAGISYVTVDDYHFLSNGKMEHELTGHFITEEEGNTLSIFPINQKLRYAIPFQDPQVTIDLLSQYATEDGSNAVVMADDGEKFGVWPGTHKTVFEEGWLRRFFSALEENSNWIRTKTFSEYLDAYPPKGRIYLPTASYFEMSEWSLPWESGEKFSDFVHEFENQGRIDDVRPFLKGGIWRNFLYKYDESNWMQKKMLYISKRLHNLEKEELSSAQRKEISEARKHLWRGMCNCAYWHGIFGGLYLPHLRHAIYGELLKGEKILDDIEFNKTPHVEIFDIDADGEKEVILSSEFLHTVISPHFGGILQEFSLKEKSFNLLNTLRRYKEAYHRKVSLAEEEPSGKESIGIHNILKSKEKGLHCYLKVDSYPRKSLVDHFISTLVNIDQFRDGNYSEVGDFITGRYNIEVDEKLQMVSLFREGWISGQRFSIKKEINLNEKSLNVVYTLKNLGDQKSEFKFGPEFNFAMLSGNSPDRYYVTERGILKNSALNSVGSEDGLNCLSIINEYDGFKVIVETKIPALFWRFPIETVSLSDEGFERIYQSSVIIPWFDVKIFSKEIISIELDLLVSDI